MIAVALARVGVENFIVVDPDKVDISHLNRQPFFQGQIRENKIKALKELLEAINLQAKVQTWQRFINLQNIKHFVNEELEEMKQIPFELLMSIFAPVLSYMHSVYLPKRDHHQKKIKGEVASFIKKAKKKYNYGPLKMKILAKRE